MGGLTARGGACRRAGRSVVAALAALVVGAAAAPHTVSAQTAADILHGAEAHYADVQTMCADFVQELQVPLLGEERTGRGSMCQAQPDRFAMRFSEPPGDVVIADGEWVWVFYPSLDDKQVIRFPMVGGAGGQAFDFHREFLHEPTAKYEATVEGQEAVGDAEAHRVRLVPRAPASYQAAIVWIGVDEPVLRKVRIEEENGSVRTVTLSGVDLAPAVDAGWFTFTPPPGAVVITR